MKESVKCMVMPFQTAYGPKVRPVYDVGGPTLTKQEFKDDCDINNILARYRDQMGKDFLNHYQGYLQGEFGDCSEVPDLGTAYEQIREGEAVFMQMPAKIRERFDNQAVKFLDFMHDSANEDEAIELGLLPPKAAVGVEPKQKA